MREKISKIRNIIKKDGIVKSIKKISCYVCTHYLNKINFFSKIHQKINRGVYSRELQGILDCDYDRVIIYKNDLGWNIPLFQRPQHMARQLAKNGCLVFYCVTSMTDKVSDIKKIEDNLYLVNEKNNEIKKVMLSLLKKVDKRKYIDCYSTDYRTTLKELKDYEDDGFRIIYEYIDDMSPEIVGTENIPKEMIEKYEYAIENKDDTFIIVTADRLQQDIWDKRGKSKMTMACNGVEIEHFKDIDKNFNFDDRFQKILDSNKKIIGYYGALAGWMDYDLVRYLAQKRPNYNVVFFGVKYDDSYKKSKIEEIDNVYFLGNKDYSVLQNYASHFDVCTIPFKVNDITNATSPVKLFEYMALEKPIVTTDMYECRKYKSVFIAKNKEQYVDLIDKAVQIENDEEYRLQLQNDALENTWDKKAKTVIDLLKNFE